MLRGGQASNEKLKHLADLKHVDTFYIWDASEITDAGLKHLSSYRKLDNVHISNSKITAKGISYFSNSNSLTKLSLQGNPFSNEILKVAGRFRKLETLWAGRGQNTINDKGISEYVPKLTNLKTLSLQKIQATEDGLKPIYKLPKLQQVYVSRPNISPEEAAKLRAHAEKNKAKAE